MTDEEKREAWEEQAQRERDVFAALSGDQLVRLVIKLQTENRRLRKRLKKAQERAERLQEEVGTRFLKSQASQWIAIATTRGGQISKLESEIRSLQQRLADASLASVRTAIEQVASLLKQAGVV